MARFGKRGTERKAPASRKQSVVHIAGPVFEQARKELIHAPNFPRKAHYAFSLTHGISRLDGEDEVGEMLGASGASIRERVVNIWQKLGHVVVMYNGEPRLGVLVEP